MANFLQSPIWGLAGVAVGALGIVVGAIIAIAVYQKQRREKALAYMIVAQTPLVSIHDKTQGEIKILFNGHEVDDVTLIMIKVWNIGTDEIRDTDFDVPLTFEFSGQLLDSQILDTIPAALNLEGGGGSDGRRTHLQLTPKLLNPGDGFTQKVLLSDFAGDIHVDAHIAGVARITEVHRSDISISFVVAFRIILGYLGITTRRFNLF